jgi:hypothetical protein
MTTSTAATITTISVAQAEERADMARAELAATPITSELRDYYVDVANAATMAFNYAFDVLSADERAAYRAYRAAA